MKKIFSASSILIGILLLGGCDSLGIRDILRDDQVPDAVRAEPRIVAPPPPLNGQEVSPRLGDVPMKPSDFAAKPVAAQEMQEMAQQRMEAQDIKRKIESEQVVPASSSSVVLTPALLPPQLAGQ